MAFNVKIERLARAELDDALAWYSLQHEKLEQSLFDRISEAIESISKSPNLYPIFSGVYRKIMLKTFPYILVFHVDTDKQLVTILSFWHTSRDPETLSANLKLYE